eukprot:GFUD01037652.1.p1 GENE.GFUD01037652.1~~GFUD01037652.1.p1  ORF type:complete len:254 (+),score=46.91 GFUD01037652.1:38-763(+)
MGFFREIQKCAENPNMPEKGKRQTLMFSSMCPDDIQTVAQEFLEDYVFLTVEHDWAVCSDVQQHFHEVPKFEKREKLEELMQDPERDPNEKTIIFVRNKMNADFLDSHLNQEGLPTTSIHGDRSQRERVKALYDFRAGSTPILVATTGAARGLDLPDVAHVINYDMPDYADDYVDMIGRTGRVGHIGKATSFFDIEEDSDIAGPLVKILAAAGTPVPNWLLRAAKASSSGGGGAGGGAAAC